MFELVRRITNINVFVKNLIRAATDLVESRLFGRQRIVFSGSKIGHVQGLDPYHEAMDDSNVRFVSMRPQKLKTTPPINRLQDARTRQLLQTYPGARLT